MAVQIHVHTDFAGAAQRQEQQIVFTWGQIAHHETALALRRWISSKPRKVKSEARC